MIQELMELFIGDRMTRDIFVISDTHFSHKNILNFLKVDGTRVRPEFNDMDVMDETMVNNWNKTVKPNDIVYHLGDFSFGGKQNIEKFANRLMGRKRLIMGNHDYDAKDYTKYFEKVMSWRQFGTDFKRPVILCHYPLDEVSFNYRGKNGVNIHGHLHDKFTGKPHHVNVCVENIGYTPISIEQIIDSI
jgi:calcineurin-like phosphoesterase family protein